VEGREKLMGTNLRPELSERNKYWLDRHRYYELKHFCLQYPLWKRTYAALEGLENRPFDLSAVSNIGISDPTGKCAEARMFFLERMNMVERVAKAADESLAAYILEAVTEGLSYENLRARSGIPCCKDTYYGLYRRFFWLLNRERE
jgi:hypothetical protein